MDPVFLCAVPAPANKAATIARMVLVLPVPGGPCKSVTVGLELELFPLDELVLIPVEHDFYKYPIV